MFSSTSLQTEEPEHEQVRPLALHGVPSWINSYHGNNPLDIVQVMTLLNDVRTLQRDKQWEKQNQPQFTDSHLSTTASLLALRLLKQQLQDWKLTIQSEHSVLEDKYSGMEVTVETLRKHNMCLQDMLTQVNSSLLNTADHTTLVITIINTPNGTGEDVSRCLSHPFGLSLLITVMWLSVFSLFGVSDQV